MRFKNEWLCLNGGEEGSLYMTFVFLFTGPVGCGKTTLARIVAREVGAGELSIREINSAENRGKELRIC